MSSPKKLACKGNLRQVFICLWPRTQYPFPPTHCVLYVYSIHTWLHDCISTPVYKLWKTPAAKSLSRSIFLDGDILLWSLYCYLVQWPEPAQKGPPRNLKYPFWVRGFILNTGYLSYRLLTACNLFGEPSCQFNFCNLSRHVRNYQIKIY